MAHFLVKDTLHTSKHGHNALFFTHFLTDVND